MSSGARLTAAARIATRLAEQVAPEVIPLDGQRKHVGLTHIVARWIEPQLEAPITLEPLAIDVKAVRGAHDQHLPGTYLLSAFASRRGVVLAQLPIGERENEISQSLPLLRQIDLNDVLVTGDALFAQRALCTHIVEQGGQYLFEVKNNQPALLQAAQRSFRDDPDH